MVNLSLALIFKLYECPECGKQMILTVYDGFA